MALRPTQAARLLSIAAASMLLGDCGRPPQKIVWDIHQGKGTRPEDIGWHPSGPADRQYDIEGDLDFTLRTLSVEGSIIRKFHQPAYRIRVGRDVMPDSNTINSIYVYFGSGLTVEEGIQRLKEVLAEWCGGLREPPAPGSLSLHEIEDGLKKGTYTEAQFTIQGRDSGLVTLTMEPPLPASGDRLKMKCRLTFRPA